MRTIDEALFRSVELAIEPKSVDEQVTVKATPETDRVNPVELENAYLKDPITFNSINKATQAIMSAGYTLKCKDTDILAYFKKFLDDIGKIGEDITFEEFLYSIFEYQMIYGNAYTEIVWNKSMSKIVDLVILDPKRIDYVKDSQQKIVLDAYGKTVGFTQTLPYGMSTEGRGDKIPKEFEEQIHLESNQIFLLSQRICHFKLYTYGDRFYGIGLIEPAWKTIVRKMNIEVAQTNSIDARGTFPLVDYIGDVMHEPTPQMIDNALIKLKDFKHNRYFAFPYWHKIEPLEIKGSDIVENTLRYLRENQCASLGMPLAFAVGSGEACYSEDTMTLTEKGWKYFWEIGKEDKIATVNPDNGNIEYHNPIDTRIYDFKGKMHHYHSSNVDILVTPKHKMFYRSTRSKEWLKNPSEEIIHSRFKFKCNVNYEGKELKEVIIPEIEYDEHARQKKVGELKFNADDWLEFIGYYVSEGWCGIEGGSYPIEIAQTKKDVLDKITSCLDRMNIKFAVKKGHGRIEGIRFNNKSLAIYLHNNFGKISQEKKLIEDYKSLSKRQLNILLESMVKGDGSKWGKTGISYYTSSKVLFNQVCDIMLKLGYAVSYNDYVKKTSVYRISGNKTRLETKIDLKKNREEIEYEGKVYCFEVPNHLFITSRNGKVAIQGNTNRATLGSQQQFLEFTLNDIVYKTVSTIRKYIFSKICKLEGFTECPTIVWGNIKAEEINDKAKRIVSYVEKGILTPDEVKSYAKQSEDLE